MKVLLISTDRNILKDGSPVRTRMSEYGTNADSIDIIVFSKKTDNVSVRISDNVTAFPTNSINRWLYFFDAISIGKKLKGADIVSSQDPFETGLAGFVISKKVGAKFHIQIHTDIFNPYFIAESFLNRLRLIIARYLLPKAHGVRVVSKRIKNSLVSNKCNLKNDPIVLPIFVDVKRHEEALLKFDLRQKYPQFEFIFLVASRLSREKNTLMILEVFERLLKKFPKIGLVIVGDGEVKRCLMLYVADHKLKPNVIFEGWQNDLSSYYKTADAFVAFSDYEGYGMTLVEAASCRIPIITSEVGLVGDVLESGKEALVCKARDTDCLVEKMSQVIEDDELRNSIIDNAYNKVNERAILDKGEYLLEYKKVWDQLLINK